MTARARSNQPQPFLKWAGGKHQLLAQLTPFFPAQFKRYHEPFLGGGAVFFHLAARHPGLRAFLSDGNAELINCYTMVRDRVEELMAALDEHAVALKRSGKAHFLAVRAQHQLTSPVARAARMIFLNKTCFNGLWRVNACGKFNVPFGSRVPATFYDAENLRAASAALRHARLRVADFGEALNAARAGDFVYLDPPYVPVSRTAAFTSYTPDGFGPAEQTRLATAFARAATRGAQLVLSNSDTPAARAAFAGFTQHTVSCRRAINSVGTGRGRVAELVVLAGETSINPPGCPAPAKPAKPPAK